MKRELQRRIAYEAARLMTEYQSDDMAYACQKAAAKLGVSRRQQMPTRDEIEEALREQQRLVRGDEQQQALQQLRLNALQAMTALKRFHPILVGSVFQGTADNNSRIRLHLFADTPEEVLFTLSDLQIPWLESQRTLVFPNGAREDIPVFQFSADGASIELIVMSTDSLHNRPLDPLDRQPIQGINLKQLREMVELPANG
ncbi:MAG: hypothetical protein KZQ93_06430 [Candidatus Thiodiazotropha sp. (ex Monitilora ramsayi)]|nr:hypothetical protein [Candidatus Thiodiazotropha sp. (ex Monitilora ramsayi)]